MAASRGLEVLVTLAPVAPVQRRPSPIDPLPEAWAVVGAGTRGSAALRALAAVGIPAIGYDRTSDLDFPGDSQVLDGHDVIAVEEIEDIDALGVTSRDLKTDAISTDYYAGVVVATGKLEHLTELGFLDREVLNVYGGRPRLARQMFTPHHPALILLGVTGGYLDSLDQESRIIARYADRLSSDPRQALAYHRQICLSLLDSLALARNPDRADVSEEQRRNLIADDLQFLGE